MEGTRIGVHDVVGLFVDGANVDEITGEFWLLSRAMVYECLSYYDENKPEIDRWVTEQMLEGP